MFERFTEQSRQVVVLAQEEARRLRHKHIGTEHILLGLVRQDGDLAAGVLESFGVTADRAREQVIRVLGSGDEVVTGQMPFTPQAKRVLELALREALSLGHDHVGTGHILLGLMREREGLAARILIDFEVDQEGVRRAVTRTMPEAAASSKWLPRGLQRRRRRERAGRPMGETWLGGLEPLLAQLDIDIQETLERDPDVGDLLLVLASLRGTIAADSLGERGIDLDSLWGTIERLRRQKARAAEELNARLNEVVLAKERAIEGGEFERAASLRDQERQLRQQAAGQMISPEAIDEIRRRLGIPSSGQA